MPEKATFRLVLPQESNDVHEVCLEFFLLGVQGEPKSKGNCQKHGVNFIFKLLGYTKQCSQVGYFCLCTQELLLWCSGKQYGILKDQLYAKYPILPYPHYSLVVLPRDRWTALYPLYYLSNPWHEFYNHHYTPFLLRKTPVKKNLKEPEQ